MTAGVVSYLGSGHGNSDVGRGIPPSGLVTPSGSVHTSRAQGRYLPYWAARGNPPTTPGSGWVTAGRKSAMTMFLSNGGDVRRGGVEGQKGKSRPDFPLWFRWRGVPAVAAVVAAACALQSRRPRIEPWIGALPSPEVGRPCVCGWRCWEDLFRSSSGQEEKEAVL